MIELRAQTGVVFLTYRADRGSRRTARAGHGRRAALRLHRADGVRHTIWRAGLDADARRSSPRSAAFRRSTSPTAIIARPAPRGRAASCGARRLDRRRRRRGHVHRGRVPGQPGADPPLQPHRQGPRRAARRGSSWRRCASSFRSADGAADAASGRARSRCTWTDAGTRSTWPACRRRDDSRASSLDVARLQHAVLEEILRIGDVRTDKRIDFVGGARGTAALEQRRRLGGRRRSRSRCIPVTVDDLMAISDGGGIMPPKSTWFEPKLRDGLLIHLI